jgi:hypothetical protein
MSYYRSLCAYFQGCLYLRGCSDLEVAHCLSNDTAVQDETSLAQNVRLDQEDAFHCRTCAHSDLTDDLPEDHRPTESPFCSQLAQYY